MTIPYQKLEETYMDVSAEFTEPDEIHVGIKTYEELVSRSPTAVGVNYLQFNNAQVRPMLSIPYGELHFYVDSGLKWIKNDGRVLNLIAIRKVN